MQAMWAVSLFNCTVGADTKWIISVHKESFYRYKIAAGAVSGDWVLADFRRRLIHEG